jgi:hypothetical protein
MMAILAIRPARANEIIEKAEHGVRANHRPQNDSPDSKLPLDKTKTDVIHVWGTIISFIEPAEETLQVS